jgi:dTDP-4-amino-4,6-dideoxygalactose transaminase
LPSARLVFYLTLKNLFKKNDEIIFSSMSFPLYIKIAKEIGLNVILVDVKKNTLNIDENKIEKNITKKTKGIVVTHLFGYPAEISKIYNIAKKNNLYLIEDCAQSFGSFYNGRETGTFGTAGIFSTSLLKIPTTLGGGILITSNKDLFNYIEDWKRKFLKSSLKKNIILFFKNLFSILNSYPFYYTILSSNIFFFLKKFNLGAYRKIIFSGMGMNSRIFDPTARPNLVKYQIRIGLSQLTRNEEMKLLRKKNTNLFINILKNNKNIKVLHKKNLHDWNYQYCVLLLKNNYNNISKKIFFSGIHFFEENVWDCTKYGFHIKNLRDKFTNTLYSNPKIIRIQNNSFLRKNNVNKIANILKSL